MHIDIRTSGIARCFLNYQPFETRHLFILHHTAPPMPLHTGSVCVCPSSTSHLPLSFVSTPTAGRHPTCSAATPSPVHWWADLVCRESARGVPVPLCFLLVHLTARITPPLPSLSLISSYHDFLPFQHSSLFRFPSLSIPLTACSGLLYLSPLPAVLTPALDLHASVSTPPSSLLPRYPSLHPQDTPSSQAACSARLYPTLRDTQSASSHSVDQPSVAPLPPLLLPPTPPCAARQAPNAVGG